MFPASLAMSPVARGMATDRKADRRPLTADLTRRWPDHRSTRPLPPTRKPRRIWRWGLLLLILAGAVSAPWLLNVFWHWRYPYRYRPLIEQTARAYQVDPLLVAAVVREESRFNPAAVSGVQTVQDAVRFFRGVADVL